MKTKTHKRKIGFKAWNLVVVIALFTFLLTPLLVTALFSISVEWQNTILPAGLTLDWYKELFTDERFLWVVARTLIVAILSVVISLIVMIPTVFIVSVYLPNLEKYLKIIVLLPFALPGIVAAVGLIKLYSSGPIAISGTIWILIGIYFIILMPFIYQSIRNSLRSVNAIELMEAAEILGAGKLKGFIRVIIPNIMPGIIVASLLSLSTIFGEFVLANMLVGGSYEVVQVYLFRMISTDGHTSSATIITFYVAVFILYAIVLKIGNMKPKKQSVGVIEEETA